MKSSRILTVYLSLAALLFGNVAGWVHVGCSAHPGCSGHPTGCCRAKLDDACETFEDDSCQHSCCHHDHADACHSETLAHSDESASTDWQTGANKQSSDPDSEAPVDHHDSDRCSICQNFFASRHAVALASDVAWVQLLTGGLEVVLVDDLFVPNHRSSIHSVRGPPSV
ncbi:hypothetical protein [Novipirellula aureliae]|uniref:hypothetical protein n=1 Tax=Novipirellula aureliae TaxID=2527966 RepID=UPI0011B6D871|nr:hypothetical protein [Novipirellula aureliae]